MTDHRPALLLLCLFLAACGPGNSTSPPNTPAASAAGGNKSGNTGRAQIVAVTQTRIESIPLILEAQGNVISLDEVDLRPQKTGTISKIHFNEGDEVKQGQLLFSLDSRDDEANLKKADARVAGSRAQRDIARRDWVRAQDLAEKNFISPSGLDATRAKLDAAESTLAQDIAALESAKVLLSYDHIAAPFAGRAGRIDVRVGSLVLANSTTSLVKITRLDPIGISFTLPERDLPALQSAQKGEEIKVRIDLAGSKALSGKIVFIESSVDRTSGTIGIKARLPNTERLLWPGQFSPVKVLAGEIKNAVTLPAQAIQNGPNGRFVYVVKSDQTVTAQPVELQQVYQERVIVTGIGEGINVVLEGGQNLRPGSKVSEASATAEKRREGKRDGSTAASLPAVRTKTDTPKTASNQSGITSAVALPEGFTPRDPEAWAKMTDEEKKERIQRWRERQTAKATGG